jgi:hypothetical protein
MMVASAIFPVHVFFLAGTAPDNHKGDAQNQDYREKLLPIHAANIIAIAKLANEF